MEIVEKSEYKFLDVKNPFSNSFHLKIPPTTLINSFSNLKHPKIT